MRLVNTQDVTNETDSSQTRSAHESETFNVEDEILRKGTERSVADHDVSHKSMTANEADVDFRIPGLPHQNQSFEPLSRIKTNDSRCG